MQVTGVEYAALLLAALVGSTLQSSIGFGMNLTIVPVAALVAPETVPAALILLALPQIVGMVAREHAHVDWHGVGWMIVGRVPGTVLGVWVVTVASADSLSATIGGLIILAAAMSAVSPPIRVTPVTASATGFVSGTMGTATSIGGPPMALLYQHHPGPVLRSTLAMSFTIGTSLSLIALTLAGEVAGWQVVLAVALTPAVLCGLWLSRHLHGILERGWLRPAVLVFAAVAGAATMVRALA